MFFLAFDPLGTESIMFSTWTIFLRGNVVALLVSDTLGSRIALVIACTREIPCLMDDPQELASIPKDWWMRACSRSIWTARRGRSFLFPTRRLTQLGCIFLDFPAPFWITAYVRVFFGIVNPFHVWFVPSLCGGGSSSLV